MKGATIYYRHSCTKINLKKFDEKRGIKSDKTLDLDKDMWRSGNAKKAVKVTNICFYLF